MKPTWQTLPNSLKKGLMSRHSCRGHTVSAHIDGILKERRADYISMARPFIREPHLIKRWKAGDSANARCISCNRCFETGMNGLGISCYWERKLKEDRRKT